MPGNAGFIGLLGLLLTLVIISIMAYLALNSYLKPPLPQKNIEKSLPLSEQGIDTASYQSVVDTTKKKLDDIQKQQLDNLKQMEEQR